MSGSDADDDDGDRGREEDEQLLTSWDGADVGRVPKWDAHRHF